jgi:hypothetical protein
MPAMPTTTTTPSTSTSSTATPAASTTIPLNLHLHIARFLLPTTALLTLGSTSKRLRIVLALRLRRLSLRAAHPQGPPTAAATHALASLLTRVALLLESLKGPWERPASIAVLKLALALVPPTLTFPKLRAFDVVCTDEDCCDGHGHGNGNGAAKHTTATATAATAAAASGVSHPFLLLLAQHASRFPALARLRLATEWGGKHGWTLPLEYRPSVLGALASGALAPRLGTLEIDTAFLGEGVKVRSLRVCVCV